MNTNNYDVVIDTSPIIDTVSIMKNTDKYVDVVGAFESIMNIFKN